MTRNKEDSRVKKLRKTLLSKVWLLPTNGKKHLGVSYFAKKDGKEELNIKYPSEITSQDNHPTLGYYVSHFSNLPPRRIFLKYIVDIDIREKRLPIIKISDGIPKEVLEDPNKYGLHEGYI